MRGLMSDRELTMINNKILLGLLLTGLSACSINTIETADVIYTNGNVYTVNNKQPWAEAFAIKDNQFLAVGNNETLAQYQGSDTRTVDLKGKMVLPGLIEDHLHPDMAAESLMGIHLKPTEMNWQQQAKIIVDTAKAENKNNGWIIGGALNWLNDNGDNILQTDMPSHFSTLDTLVSHRPIMLWDIGGHAVLLNSQAMRILNITVASENPKGGIIVRDKRGIPTGVLRETAANWAYEIALENQPRGKKLIEQGIKPVFSQLNGLGFTAASDAWARSYFLDAYRDMADNNELNLRIKAYIADPIEWTSDAWKKAARHAIENHQSYYRDQWLDASGVKFVLDGSAGGQTIIMVEPYEGTKDVHGGPWRNDPDYYRRKFKEYDAKGLTIKSHAVGSQTIRTVLDAIEESRSNGSKLRHSIAHTVFVHPQDLPRFKSVDAIAEFSPYFWYPVSGWDMVRDELGQHRLDWAFPFKTLIDAGVHISVGSDWPVSDYPDPFPEIESMVTRRAPGGKSEIKSSKDQRVSLAQAIHVFTMGGAYAQGRENSIGSIETGKLADFIVLDQHLFDIDVHNIHRTQVLKTVIDGRTVFNR
jgi:predicted amidohydrolase YtcJ